MRLHRSMALGLAAVLITLFAIGWRYRWHRLDPLPDTRIEPLPVSVMPYHELAATGNPRLTVRLERGTGKLLYIGTHHTTDPDDPQIEEIIRLWEEFEPTLALVEGRLGFYVGGLSGGVAMFGEAGAVFALARADDVPVYTLEPTLKSELRAVLTEWRPDRVAMFYVLRGALSRGNPAARQREAAQLVRKRTGWPGLGGSLRNLAELDSLYRAELTHLPDWRTADGAIVWPGRSTSYLNEISTTVNRFRDEYMLNLLREQLDEGERIFAVVGTSHVIMQEPVLRALATVVQRHTR
jgi:hypothetical protein